MPRQVCPNCGKVYGEEYADTFCLCGTGLEVVLDSAVVTPDGERPPPGTRCLVLYGADRQPLRYFPLERDVTVVGRQDALEGNFPEIDVSEWLDPATARAVSRKHAMVLRSRDDGTYKLRPLAGNTGTQLDAEMVSAQQDYPLNPGARLILGGAVRFKFEIT